LGIDWPALASPGPAASWQDSSIALRWQPERKTGPTNRWAVEVRGLSRATRRHLRQATWTETDWQKVLSVTAEQGSLIADVGLPPMLGNYRLEGDSLWFHPRFPLEPGVAYQATLRLRHVPVAPIEFSLSSTFRVPAAIHVPTTVVKQVYPTTTQVPENLLKFYLQFSAPMSGGHIYEHIRLVDQAGASIELPFLEIDEELWDPSMTRLTLFIDPGRIKRGVTPLEEVGPALLAGRSFSLLIDAAWPDATGAPLKASFRKSFQVGPPDRTPIDPAKWTIRPPAAGSKRPLVVRFDRPLDWALARRLLDVRRPNGTSVPGTVALNDEEREWRFTPERPWPKGSWDIVVPTTIEDLAGNNIGKSFEVDLFENVQRRVTNSVTRLKFEIR
jgi:hypothetical protein